MNLGAAYRITTCLLPTICSRQATIKGCLLCSRLVTVVQRESYSSDFDKTTFAASEKLTDSQVLDILQQTNEAIRYRLAVSDHIPDDARSYTIGTCLQPSQQSTLTIYTANGRVLFTIPHQFQGSFTVGGSETTDPWHLLDINFLFNPTSSKDQQDLFKVEGPLHDRILDMGNHLLSEEAMAAAAATEGQQISMDKLSKDPLARVFNFLRALIIKRSSVTEFGLKAIRQSTCGWRVCMRKL